MHCDLQSPVTLGSRHPSYAITEQIITVSHERLGERPLGRLDPETISQLRTAIREMIDI